MPFLKLWNALSSESSKYEKKLYRKDRLFDKAHLIFYYINLIQIKKTVYIFMQCSRKKNEFFTYFLFKIIYIMRYV